MSSSRATRSLPVVVLISGRGSNLQSIIDSTQRGELPIEIRAVVSNQPDAYGLVRAQRAGLETRVLDNRGLAERRQYDRALWQLIDNYRPALVLLAGFMRILTPEFVDHYRGRLMNIHPSLLPAFPGLNTHQRALKRGVAEHGASVHFVTSEVDGGPVVIRARVPVSPNDNAQSLADRVLDQEHRIYPLAVRWFAEGRLHFDGKHATLDGTPLPPAGVEYRDDRPGGSAS